MNFSSSSVSPIRCRHREPAGLQGVTWRDLLGLFCGVLSVLVFLFPVLQLSWSRTMKAPLALDAASKIQKLTAPEHRVSQKENIVSQAPFFGTMLVSGTPTRQQKQISETTVIARQY